MGELQGLAERRGAIYLPMPLFPLQHQRIAGSVALPSQPAEQSEHAIADEQNEAGHSEQCRPAAEGDASGVASPVLDG
jgi:hypothetical protein